MAQVFLGFGSNLGNREQYIQNAIALIQANNIPIVQISSMIETEPVGGPPQGHFLNAVVEVQTTHSPLKLLTLIKQIEHQIGRQKTVRNGPRVIDIDILLYDRIKLKTPQLTIPHPRMFERDFVMKPLREIASDVVQEYAHANYYIN